jgi:hypothetical protein
LVALSARVKNEEFADEIVKKGALPKKISLFLSLNLIIIKIFSCTRSKDRHLRSSQLANLTPDQSRNRGEKKNRRMSKNKSCKQLFK